MPTSLKQGFISYLTKKYPSLAQAELENLISDNLLSPFEVQLPATLLQQAQEFVDAAFTLRELPHYQQKILENHRELFPSQPLIKDPGNKAIAMSYDFHVDGDGLLKLIEVNTNASFLALGYEMYEFRQRKLPVADFSPEEIRSNILTELNLHHAKNSAQKKSSEKIKVAIVDEQPSAQKLFSEFLVYQEWFRSWEWEVEIKDVQEPLSVDFIYNRFTDFYLNGPKASNLQKIFNENSACLSPNPFEYLLLADKQRMIDWNQEGFLQSCGLDSEKIQNLQRNLPQAKALTKENAEEIWQKRKKYFFKPLRAFGAKQSYRGASVSRKIFDELIDQEFIAQEFVPAPERIFETPEGQQNFKFDLRFYAYQNRVQGVVARIYQGQVTNLRTPFGGFAPIRYAVPNPGRVLANGMNGELDSLSP